MENCPACGAALEGDEQTCPECRALLDETTGSFPLLEGEEGPIAVGVGEGPLLIVRKGPEVGERFYIDRPVLTIGRDPGSDIFLNDITVSRRHAILETVADTVTVSDAGSLNGTYVNSVSVDRTELSTGDQLQVGRFQMVFLGGEDGNEA